MISFLTYRGQPLPTSPLARLVPNRASITHGSPFAALPLRACERSGRVRWRPHLEQGLWRWRWPRLMELVCCEAPWAQGVHVGSSGHYARWRFS
jgi:hypothetical protein